MTVEEVLELATKYKAKKIKCDTIEIELSDLAFYQPKQVEETRPEKEIPTDEEEDLKFLSGRKRPRRTE